MEICKVATLTSTETTQYVPGETFEGNDIHHIHMPNVQSLQRIQYANKKRIVIRSSCRQTAHACLHVESLS